MGSKKPQTEPSNDLDEIPEVIKTKLNLVKNIALRKKTKKTLKYSTIAFA